MGGDFLKKKKKKEKNTKLNSKMFFVIFPGKLQMMNDFVYEYQTHMYTTFFGSLIIVCEITCVMCVDTAGELFNLFLVFCGFIDS